MGVTGGVRPNARNVAHMADQIPGGPEGPNNWQVIGICRDQWKLLATSLVLGGNVRAGPRGQPLPARRRDGPLERRPDRQGAPDGRGHRPPRREIAEAREHARACRSASGAEPGGSEALD